MSGQACHDPRMAKKKDRLPDPNQHAKSILDALTAQVAPDQPEKNPFAVALGRLGGLKGGHARAKALSKAERAEIAKKAAKARWKGNKKKGGTK